MSFKEQFSNEKGVLHHLVDRQLRISPDVEAFDAELDGDAEVAEEGLVLRHVVGRGEVQAHHIADVLSEGLDKEQAHACAHFSH